LLCMATLQNLDQFKQQQACSYHQAAAYSNIVRQAFWMACSTFVMRLQ